MSLRDSPRGFKSGCENELSVSKSVELTRLIQLNTIELFDPQSNLPCPGHLVASEDVTKCPRETNAIDACGRGQTKPD